MRALVTVAVALTIVPLFNPATWTAPVAHLPLWGASPSPQSVGVYLLLVAGAFYGLLRKGNVPLVCVAVCLLIATMVDARLAPAFALAAAPLALNGR